MGNGDISANSGVGAVTCSGAGRVWFRVEGYVEGAGGYVVGSEEWQFCLEWRGGGNVSRECNGWL